MSSVLVCTNYKTKLIALSGVAVTIFGSTMFLSPPDALADDVIDEVTLSVPISCTMTGVGMDTHVVTLKNGQANSNVGETTIKAYCNDMDGFAIYAIGYTNDTDGKNVLTDAELGSDYDIATGTATGPVSDVDTSNWAMKVTTFAPDTSPAPTYPITIQNDFDSFHTVPTTYAMVAKRDAGTDVGIDAEGSTLKTTYQVYVSKTQLAGAYTGKVKYTMVHPADADVPASPQTTGAGKICYYANASDAEGTMGCQSISSSAASATLLASNFSRAGYGFAGWSDKYDYTTNPSAKFYGPQETITFTAGQYTSPNNGLSLYAVWVKSQGSLQDTTKVAELCGTSINALTTAPTDGTANLASVSALTDQRDNETYAIAKLADGNCWMIENLRLESEDTVGNNRFDSLVTNQSLAQGYGTSATYGNFGGLADPESANFINTVANSLYYSGTQSGDATINIGTSNYPAFRMPRYNNLNTPTSSANRPQNPTRNTFTDNNTTAGMYSYGNYYTWHAAIADTTYYDSGDHGTTSLCPTGWRLPQGNTATSGFGKLDVDMGGTGATQSTAEASNRWRKYPANFLYSGNFYSSSAYDRGSNGYYWSSTAFNYNYSYGLHPTSSRVYPGTGNSNKNRGLSVRCMVSAST